MTTASNSKIFTAAWDLARSGASKFGGSARAYFADALRQAYAFIRANSAPKASTQPTAKSADHSTGAKLDSLSTVAAAWPQQLRGSFAYRFITENFERLVRFGPATKFSPKQIQIIDDMFVKYC